MRVEVFPGTGERSQCKADSGQETKCMWPIKHGVKKSSEELTYPEISKAGELTSYMNCGTKILPPFFFLTVKISQLLFGFD